MAYSDEELDNYFGTEETPVPEANSQEQAVQPEAEAQAGEQKQLTDEERTLARYNNDPSKLARGYIELQGHTDKRFSEMQNQINSMQQPAQPEQPINQEVDLSEAMQAFENDPYRMLNTQSKEYKNFVQALDDRANKIADEKLMAYENARVLQEQKDKLLKTFPDAEEHIVDFVNDMQNPNMQLVDLYKIWQDGKQIKNEPVTNKPPVNGALQAAARNQQRAPSAANISGISEDESSPLTEEEKALQGQFGDIF
jgi:hypothetical protein